MPNKSLWSIPLGPSPLLSMFFAPLNRNPHTFLNFSLATASHCVRQRTQTEAILCGVFCRWCKLSYFFALPALATGIFPASWPHQLVQGRPFSNTCHQKISRQTPAPRLPQSIGTHQPASLFQIYIRIKLYQELFQICVQETTLWSLWDPVFQKTSIIYSLLLWKVPSQSL